MSLRPGDVREFMARHAEVISVTLTDVRGSSPREAGTVMLVSEDSAAGTIGGGHMEHMAIDTARQILRGSAGGNERLVALGPGTGQCCGGRVTIRFDRLTSELVDDIEGRLIGDAAAQPDIYIFGAGHVGRALARALGALPFRVHVVDERTSELGLCPQGADLIHAALPEQVVRAAPKGSGFVVLTHDHALDFMIVREALMRRDAFYVGMIGSKAKRAVFRSWLKENGDDPALARPLVCPIGNKAVDDKRPEVIAALAAAEVLVQSHATRMGTPGRLGAADDKLGVV